MIDYSALYLERKAREKAAMLPKKIAAADTNEVIREQLDYLIEHARNGPCGCPDCRRYSAARAVLMEPFSERTETVSAWSAAGE